MHKRNKSAAGTHKKIYARSSGAARVARKGITSSSDAKQLVMALIRDILDDKVPTTQANSAINAVGRLVRLVELEFRYGGKSRKFNI